MLQDEWPNGETGTAIDSGDPSKDADRTVIDTDLLHGSSGSSSLDGEIASAGFGRPGSDELGEGSPQGASLVQGDWSYSPTKLGPTDFELLRVVGQGAFGKVCSFSLSVQSFWFTTLGGITGILASMGFMPGMVASKGRDFEAWQESAYNEW